MGTKLNGSREGFCFKFVVFFRQTSRSLNISPPSASMRSSKSLAFDNDVEGAPWLTVVLAIGS